MFATLASEHPARPASSRCVNPARSRRARSSAAVARGPDRSARSLVMSRSEPPPRRFSGSSPEVGKARLAVGEPRHTYRSTREPLYTPGGPLGPFSTTIWLEVRLDEQWVAAYRLGA